jgi:exopolysaccharide biosynthesis polyprenyl glycosylphosphotransferase
MAILETDATTATGNASLAPERRKQIAAEPAWMSHYVHRVLAVDVVAVLVASGLAKLARFGEGRGQLHLNSVHIPYIWVAAVAVPVWLLVMAATGAYDRRELGVGTEEFRRIVSSGVYFFALAAGVAFLAQANLARGFVALVIPLLIVLTTGGRVLNRRWLRRQRRRGQAVRKVLVVGSANHVRDVIDHFDGAPWTGYRVVAARLPQDQDPDSGSLTVGTARVREIPVLSSDTSVLDSLADSGADVLAVAGLEALEIDRLQTLSWEIEGSGVDLIVVPAITDVAGPRIAIRPVSGLPLLHVEEPRLTGTARVGKACFDRAIAGLSLLVLAPLFLVLAAAVRLSSRGPALFHQERVGRGGELFRIHKFRTMVQTAELEREDLDNLNEVDGALFKIRRDPRITPIGRLLRRYSLDELPQLFNVLKGDMSLVGPRPPLRREVEQYTSDVKRRLLVKPGLTGLWQVSGRSDLAWDEAVRLDLYYVDNWSPTLDLVIIWRTLNALLGGRGAY